ncbi:TraR/DksA family transcriptional regulator [Candidatus Chrysopegis kryptomonas]|uniref:Transcriptional regulator, TraR/DksA family n=1 Tax=Candidatus Chryseopegocella kryptomonas TaxID=1633643 RepID=A0A0P1MW75_9BACT|nr:TraR/DksA family transcriptional regulator [Candidatus Chrysopegis kryptomonas]CUT00202.1 transcriptional regulator, TraR/DksA family [Candidatus Chrysopegis kryptomonas]
MPAKKKKAKSKKTQSRKRSTGKKTRKKEVKKQRKKVQKKAETIQTATTPTESQTEQLKQNTPSTGEQTQKTSYTKEELQHFKEILLKKRQEILEMLEAHRQSLIESTTQNDKPVGTPYSIHMEYGTETEEREKTMFFIAREEKMLNYIDAALMRIERGTYGVCISCGKLIDKRRLEAVPHTQLCIECKLAQKKKF